jgi:type I restriction enzyme, S subunit
VGMSEWIETTVGELAASTRNALVGGPFGSNLVSKDYIDHGVPVIRGQNMGARWVGGEFAYVSPEKAKALVANTARPGDIVFTQRGTLGQVALVPNEPFETYVVSQSQMKVTVDPTKADPLFLYYLFSSQLQQEYIRQNAIQVGVPHTNLGILRNTPVLIPRLVDVQRDIARYLGSLDDKIELNRRTSHALEAMAQAIFQSWFIDFDPVRAKASGEHADSICQRLGLTPELLSLFPDSLIETEIGPGPEGWPIEMLGELCDRVAMGPFGSDIKTDNFVSEGVPVIRGGNLKDGFGGGGFVYLTAAKADDLRNANAFPGDIVITHRGTLGQVGLIPTDAEFPRYVISQSQLLLGVDENKTTARYVYEFMRSPHGQHSLLSNTSQVGVPAISRPTTSVKAIRILNPSMPVLQAYDAVTDSLYAAIGANSKAIGSISEIRDSLLPELLNAKLSPPNLTRSS